MPVASELGDGRRVVGGEKEGAIPRAPPPQERGRDPPTPGGEGGGGAMRNWGAPNPQARARPAQGRKRASTPAGAGGGEGGEADGAHMRGRRAQPVDRAVVHGCEALQIFSKNANQWHGRPLDPAEIVAFRRAHRRDRHRAGRRLTPAT